MFGWNESTSSEEYVGLMDELAALDHIMSSYELLSPSSHSLYDEYEIQFLLSSYQRRSLRCYTSTIHLWFEFEWSTNECSGYDRWCMASVADGDSTDREINSGLISCISKDLWIDQKDIGLGQRSRLPVLRADGRHGAGYAIVLCRSSMHLCEFQVFAEVVSCFSQPWGHKVPIPTFVCRPRGHKAL